MTREQLIKSFLKENNIENYQIIKIAGDASFRNYFRIKKGEKSFVLMDAPPEKENVSAFCNIANFLLQNGFSAPKIFAKDKQNGILLLEDFGDDSYRKFIENGGDEINLYKNAVNLLVDLQNFLPPQDLEIYNQDLLLKEAMLFVDWYIPNLSKKQITDNEITDFKEIFLELLNKLSLPKCLVLRDYHSENLMLIEHNLGINQIGLLDFQDAVIGNCAYDLVSLLEDARRDVSFSTQEKMLQHYLTQSKCDGKQFMVDYQILSLQRNIKIIGIFSRLAFRDQKKIYLNFLPRVFKYVNKRLEDSELFKIKEFLRRFF